MYTTSRCKLEDSYEQNEDFLGPFLHGLLTGHHGCVTDFTCGGSAAIVASNPEKRRRISWCRAPRLALSILRVPTLGWLLQPGCGLPFVAIASRLFASCEGGEAADRRVERVDLHPALARFWAHLLGCFTWYVFDRTNVDIVEYMGSSVENEPLQQGVGLSIIRLNSLNCAISVAEN